MKKEKIIQILDQDWITLIMQAKSIGLTKEEVRKALNKMGHLEKCK